MILCENMASENFFAVWRAVHYRFSGRGSKLLFTSESGKNNRIISDNFIDDKDAYRCYLICSYTEDQSISFLNRYWSRDI